MTAKEISKTAINCKAMSLDDIKALTDIDKIRECLKQVELEEEEMDKQISLKMQNKDLFFRELNAKLEKTAKPNLDNLGSQINDLKGNLEESYKVGLEPLNKLVYLYEQQNSVNDLLSQLRSTKNIKIYQEELKLGIENNDLNQSIQSINNYLNTDIESLKKGYFSKYFKNDDHFNVEKFENYRLELIEKLESNYREGVKNNNKDMVLDQIKKLPKLGEPGLAIKLLNDYIADPLINEDISGSSSPILQLKQLLEALAFQVTEYQEWIGDHFGSGWFLSWLHQLIEKVSPTCYEIFKDFKMVNDWDATIQRIHLSSMSSVNQAGKTTPTIQAVNEIDIKEVDRILDELTFMCQKIRLFELLALNKINEEKLSILSEKALSRHHYSCPVDLIESSLNHLVGDYTEDIQLFPQFRESLMNQYPLIEKFYFSDTIKQAIDMDEYEEGNGTSSSVDDSFYLIKKGSFRSLTTCQLETFQRSISIYKEVLTKLVLPSFDPKPKSTGPGGAQVTTLKNMLISINNTGTSQKYVNTLIAELQSVCQKILTSFPSGQKLEFETCILSLNEVETRFKRSHQTNFDRLISRSLMPKLSDFMLGLSQESDYILEKEEDIQLLSTIELKFKSRVQPFLKPYETNLLDFNFKYLIEKICEIISKQFEVEFINKKRFNWFGAQKLDSDLRLIIQFLSSLTDIYIKDLFRIPITICDILIQEEIEHVRDILPDDLIDFSNSNTNGDTIIRGGDDSGSTSKNKISLDELANWMKLRQDWDSNKIEDFIISLIPSKSD